MVNAMEEQLNHLAAELEPEINPHHRLPVVAPTLSGFTWRS